MFWSIKAVFRLIETCKSSFFLKTQIGLFPSYFFKLSSLSPIWQGSTEDFLSFSTKVFEGFCLPRPIRPFYPSFCIYFLVFMHKLMHLKGSFGTFLYWDFCWINPLFLKLIIRFCFYIVIFMIYIGWFDQFGALWKIENSRVCNWSELGFLFKVG